MKTAIILCRPIDLPIAVACRQRMTDLGWAAKIMIDPSEWEALPADVVHGSYGTKGRGMFGNDCAMAILDGMIANSAGSEVVMKMDCDVWISEEASQWFQTRDNGRAMKVHYHKTQVWGGCWSATRDQLLKARIAAESLQKCRCAESYLNLMALHYSGDLTTRNELVTQWTAGQDRGLVATLPITRRENRTEEGLALFDTANN